MRCSTSPRRHSHAAVSQACLDAGVHVYSEKPIAGTLAEADRLIETAAEKSVLLLCAPGTAALRRFAWVREIVASGRYGPLTLAFAQYPDAGPASWREYTGDPAPFYGPDVGPLRDHGVYRLHELTTVMGPVARVQAMGAIGVPERVAKSVGRHGATFEVTAPDHVLVNLEFVSGALGQLLSSFGALATRGPWLELHFARATLSFDGDQYDKDSPASLYVEDRRCGRRHRDPAAGRAAGGGGSRRGPLPRLPARRRAADPHRRACPPRARHHPQDLRVDRGRQLASHRDALLT